MADTALTLVKIAFIICIFAMAFIAGMLPGIIPWCKKSTGVLGIANAFSGGVFIAIALLHIMPEVAEGYNEWIEEHEHDHDHFSHSLKHGDESHFPLPFALIFAGYSFILLIDKVVFDTHSLVGEHHHGHTHDPVQSQFIQNAKSSFVKFQQMNSSNDCGDDCNGGQHFGCINDSDINQDIKNYLSRNDKFAVRMSVALRHPLKKHASRTFAGQAKGLDDDQTALFHDADNINLKDTVGDNQVALIPEERAPKMCSCNLTPVVLMIALSTHAVFEGIAVGVVDELSDLWTYVIAIGLHKWAAAMSLGISMSKNFQDEKKTIYLLLIIFS